MLPIYFCESIVMRKKNRSAYTFRESRSSPVFSCTCMTEWRSKSGRMWSRRDRVLVELVWDNINIKVAVILKLSGIGRVNLEMIGHLSSKGHDYRVLIGKFFVFRPNSISTRSFPHQFDRYSTNSRSLLEWLASRSLLECFWHVKNSRVEIQIDDEQGRLSRTFLSIELDQSPDHVICLGRAWSSWSDRQCEPSFTYDCTSTILFSLSCTHRGHVVADMTTRNIFLTFCTTVPRQLFYRSSTTKKSYDLF